MKKRVLIVEDMIDVALVVRRMMHNKGYSVDLACNGRDAVLKLESRKYDFVITDMLKPGRDGRELAQYIRETQGDIPVLAITGADQGISPQLAASAPLSPARNRLLAA
jgi:CheY-like chemotaxis protein